ncbi:MAG: TolC family protein [Vicinamibacterales bacterium]
MIRRLSVFALLLGLTTGVARAQTPLTLADAVARAQARNHDARAAEVAEQRADAELTAARGTYLPNVDVTESWQRGNQPVFVFGSLLAQRQFTAANFAIDALNHPDPVNNLRLGVSVDQAVFDPVARANVKAASIGRDVAATARELVAHDLAVAVTAAYGHVLTADAAVRSAEAAVASAEADLTRARNRRDAGTATEADVLQVEVLAGRAREQRIRSGADAAVARARLNDLMGEPLDAAVTLVETPDPQALAETSVAALEAMAVAERPNVKLAGLREQLARASTDAARASFLPRLSAQGAWEANGDTFTSRSSSWAVGAVARVNLFRGPADHARVAAARHAQTLRAIDREKAEAAARLDVRVALARLEAARAAEAVTRTAVAQAHESQRIIRDRYESGLADVTALLAASEGVQQAEARQAAARVEITVAAATLTRAIGQR